MVSLLALIIMIWFCSGVLLALHRISPRVGFTPLLMIMGGLVFVINMQRGVYLEPFPNLYMFATSNIFVPAILMIVLVMYVACGAQPARLIILSVIGGALLTLAVLYLYQWLLTLPNAGSISGFTSADFMINPRITLGSLLAFTTDMFVIVVFYQGLYNTLPRLPEWVMIGMALMAALWTDVIVFRFIADLGTTDFITLLPGDLLGKTLAGLILLPPTAYYLVRIAPTMPQYVGGAQRPTFDVFQGSLTELKLALVSTQAALQQSEYLREKEQLQLSLEQQKIKFMQDFLDDISHDLKSPLTSINLKVHMLERIDQADKRRMYADDIRQLTLRMTQMLDDLLMLARLENTPSSRLELLDLNSLLQAALMPFQAIIAQRNLLLKFSNSAAPLVCRGVRGDLQRMFENLIGNAVNYTPYDGRISIETSASQYEVMVQITDTGIGISATDLPHIYSRFYRSKNAQEFSSTGTGLGLSIVQKVLLQHQGRIEVMSEEGKGTTFIVYLPRANALATGAGAGTRADTGAGEEQPV